MLVLVCSGDWGDCEFEAWILFSDIVVENRPTLPLSARTWLFQQLNDLANKQRRLEQRCRKACALRLSCKVAAFIGPDENGNDSFLYDKVFVVRGGNDTKQVEDIVSLFELTFALIHCVDPEDASKQAVLNGCRASLLDLIQAEGRPLNQKPFDGNGGLQPSSTPLPTTDKNLPYYVAFYCLALALRAAQKEKTMLDGKDSAFSANNAVRTSRMGTSGAQICFEVGNAAILAGAPSQICTLACRHWTSNVKHSVPVRLALYDMIVDLLLGPRSMSRLQQTSFLTHDASIVKAQCLVQDQKRSLGHI